MCTNNPSHKGYRVIHVFGRFLLNTFDVRCGEVEKYGDQGRPLLSWILHSSGETGSSQISERNEQDNFR